MVLYLSYHASNLLFVQFCAIEYIGTRYLNASTLTLRPKVMAMEVVILSSELTILDLFVTELFLHFA